MNKEHIELLERLESFKLDDGDVALSFTQRLARENGWPHRFAERVVNEYKRFAFLAAAAGHPVTPSDEVDQAWHLHLTYTQSYWKRFCGEVLRQPLHHNPTKGGAAESDKFVDWYAKTLESYECLFGCPPPADIWPEATVRFGEATRFVRVNARRHWILPRPRWFQLLANTSVLGLVVLVSTGCVGTLATLNIFDLHGPEFLLFYVLACVPGFLCAWMLRRQLSLPDGTIEAGDTPRDPYVIATLAGGARAAFNAALIALCERQIVGITDKATVLVSESKSVPDDLHPLERRLYDTATSSAGCSPKELSERFEPCVQPIIKQLKQRGLVVDSAEARRAMLVPLLVALAIPALGVIKVMVGISRGKPVGFLVVLLVISVIAAIILCLRRPHQSRLGRKVVERLRLEHSRLKIDPMKSQPATGSMLPMAVGLFGVTVLAQTPLAALQKRLTPPPGSNGCGSSCGSGGDGGGGCGGGGCGGCGGGGD